MSDTTRTPRWFHAARAVLPEGVRANIAIAVDGGRIAALRPAREVPEAMPLGPGVVLPGLVDSHVHVNEPGRTAWEGFATATRAAAAGGITTIVDMPLNSVPATVSVEALRAKRAAAAGHCHVDVAFWGGVVPGNADAIGPLAAAGVRGFKCFMSPSGVDEFHHVTVSDLGQAMPAVARTGLPLLVHAEWPEALVDATGDPRAYATWLASRPVQAEVEAIRAVLDLAARTGCRVHIVHVACGEGAALIRDAAARGVAVTAETCPHYLTFAAEAIPPGATAFKCAPPIRDASQREALWEALARGELQLVASDHSPCPPDLKCPDTGDFLRAWGGIAAIELTLAATWTAASARGHGLEPVVEWMAAAPARLASLPHKGALAVGRDADFVLVDPDARWQVDQQALHQRHPVTPYHALTLRGRVLGTWLRGEPALDGARFAAPAGRLIPEHA